MKKLQFFVISLVAMCFLAISTVGISQGPPAGVGPGGGGARDAPDKETKEKIYRNMAKAFNIDEGTIRNLDAEFEKGGDMSFKEIVMLTNLVAIRADKLIEQGKYTKDQRKEAIEDSIKDLSQRHRDSQGRGWGELALDEGIPIKNFFMLVVSASHVLDNEEVYDVRSLQKNLEKQGLPSEDALKIIILARYQADETVTSKNIQKNPNLKTILEQQGGVLQESIKYFFEKRQKGVSWEDLAHEVGLSEIGLNKLAQLLAVQI